LHQVKHGQHVDSDDFDEPLYVYPYHGKLLVAIQRHGIIQVRSHDAKKVLQTITVPYPYMVTSAPPVFYQDDVYFGLTHLDSFDNGMKGGILMLKAADNSLDTIPEFIDTPLEPRPPMSVSLVKNEQGDDVYQVDISHDDLDQTIKFSIIALQETAFKHAKYLSSPETNKNHHGQLRLRVASAPLLMGNDELLSKLAVIKERVERNLIDEPKAGDGKSAFKVDIELI